MVLIDGLKAGTEYELQATASNKVSESARTDTITANTMEEESSGTSDTGTTAAIVIVVVIIVLVIAIAATVTVCVCKDKKDSKTTDRSANYREAANTERALTDNQQTHQTKPVSPREEPRRVQEAPVSAPVPQQQPARQQQPVSPRGGAISNGIEVEQNNHDLEMVPRRQAADKPTRTAAPEQVQMQFENQNPPELMTSPRQQQQQTPIVTATTDGNYIDKMAQGMKQRISIARRDPTSQQKRRDDIDEDQPEGESSINP